MSSGLIRETIKLVGEFIEELDGWCLEDVRIGLLYTGVKNIWRIRGGGIYISGRYIQQPPLKILSAS